MRLTIYSWYTDETLITLKLTEAAQKIRYFTHPNNSQKTRLGERPFTLAEILRMPSPLLRKFFGTLTQKQLDKLTAVIKSEFKKERINAVCFNRFTKAA
jgi:hypothetical protein